MTHNCDLPKVSNYKKIILFIVIKTLNLSSKDLDPSSEELEEIVKLLAEKRGIKGIKSMSEHILLSALTSSKSVKKSEKAKIKLSKPRIEKVRKQFNESRHKFSKSKVNEIRRNLYELENEKNPFASKIKEIERNLTELE